MSSLQKSIMRAHLPPFVPSSTRSRDGGSRKGRQKDYNPGEWSNYYAEKRDIQLDEKTVFRVYLSKPSDKPDAPIVLLLHGGGYSALTWSHFTTEVTSILHCQCLAIDLRGHGDTQVEDEADLSAETLAADVGKVIAAMYPESSPPIMIVGHSMGGAICVHIAHLELIPALIGCVVIDVVEGTAMEALASMQSFLRSRPQYFRSIQQAIEWSVRSGQIRNVASAKVSMPGQIVNISTGKLATNELPLADEMEVVDPNSYSNPLTIAEDSELDTVTTCSPTKNQRSNVDKKYTWRIDLAKSEKYWSGWFENLSQKFLDLRVPKLLLLASIDGLDRTLTVGQMQGRFQLQVLARCGHVVHEDRPHEVAEVIASYMIRNKFAEAAGNFVRQMPAC